MIEANQTIDQKNRATRVITAVVGIMLAFAGLEHGLFEVFQGNKPTDGLIIQAIGESMRWWKYGTEEAFTLIPNYLITGICAMAVSIFIIIWSLWFVDKKNGTTVFLSLFIMLTLVGGGIGFIPFYIVTWAYATRIHKPLNWWRRILGRKLRRCLAAVWPYALVAGVFSWLILIEIAIWGYVPGQTDSEIISNISALFLLLTMVFINLSFISGFAFDIERQAPERE